MAGRQNGSAHVLPAVVAAVESIRELRHLLNACESTCHDPAQFVVNLNGFVQAARNVTFRLQAYKGDVPKFDEWYEPWQSAMRANPIMVWLKDARNKVVKQRGLKSLSTAPVTSISSYRTPDVQSFDVPPFMTTKEIVETVSERIHSPVDRLYGVIEVRRSWVL